jgi:hypothetical protein
MPERDNDPIANTQMFRAFVQRGEAEAPSAGRNRGRLLAIAAVAVVLAAVLAVVIVKLAG